MDKDINMDMPAVDGEKAVKADNNECEFKLEDASTLATSILARTEAMGIIVNLLNAFFAIIQNRSDFKFSDEEINQIQTVINLETQRTNDLYNAITELVKQMPQSDAEKGE